MRRPDMLPIKTKSFIAEEMLEIAKQDGGWFPYYNFRAKPIPHEVIVKDRFLQWLSARYEFIAGVIKMEPYEQYDWHIDTRRGVSINMLLEHDDSAVLFSDDPFMLVKKIYPYKYEPDTYYLFNTQVAHCVINYSKPRYLFSIEFKKNKLQLTYNDLCSDVANYYQGDSDE